MIEFTTDQAKRISERASLTLTNMSLNTVESEFVNEQYPQYIQLLADASFDFSIGGNREGTMERNLADKLDASAKEKLSTAGVSKGRQRLLKDLVYFSNPEFVGKFGVKNAEERYVVEARRVHINNRLNLLSRYWK